MSKVLSDGRIQVEAGDTLSGIYGANWKQLSGYTGDPTTLPIGTILPAKQAGSLGGTLNQDTTNAQGKTLPGQSVDRLSMFQDVIKSVTARAAQEAKASGGSALPEGMLKPSEVSGGTFADILGMVNQEKTRGISDIYESTVNAIENTRAMADDQLRMLVSTGAIATLDDASLKKLSDETGYPLNYLEGMREMSIQNAAGDDDDDDDELDASLAIGYVVEALTKNSELSDNQLFLDIKGNSNLSDSSITRAIEEARKQIKDKLGSTSFDDISKAYAKTIEEAKKLGFDRDSSKTKLIAEIKEKEGLDTKADLSSQYNKLVENILYAVYGATGAEKFWPGGRGSDKSVEEMRSKLGL